MTYKTAWRMFRQIRSLLSETDMQIGSHEGHHAAFSAALHHPEHWRLFIVVASTHPRKYLQTYLNEYSFL